MDLVSMIIGVIIGFFVGLFYKQISKMIDGVKKELNTNPSIQNPQVSTQQPKQEVDEIG